MSTTTSTSRPAPMPIPHGLAVDLAPPGIQIPDPTRGPGKPPPLPPGGIIPDETPPPSDEPQPDPDDAEIRDPGRRMPPDHLPGGPSNPNPHHAREG